MVTTTNPDMAARMRRLRNHGSPRRYVHEEVGWNSRLDAIQAAILRVKLKYVEGWNEARRQHAATYDRLFISNGMAKISADQAHARKTASPLHSILIINDQQFQRTRLSASPIRPCMPIMCSINTSSELTVATNCVSS